MGKGLTSISLEWLSDARLEDRKALGQYMTPEPIRERLLDILEKHTDLDNKKVLDPGVGTAEFLRSYGLRSSNAELYGWDINPEILGYAERQLEAAGLPWNLSQASALDYGGKEEYDIVIGNPPYFQFKPETELKKKFAPVITGRTNIFSLFFFTGIQALRPGGHLAFVVPPSMNNGSYFQGLRSYIAANTELIHLEIVRGSETHADTDSFADANTAAQIIVLRKKEEGEVLRENPYIFSKRFSVKEKSIFTENKSELLKKFDSPTLYELGYQAKTGGVVWNQYRERLTSDKQTTLIWADNITPEGIVLKETRPNPDKKQYIDLEDTNIKPILGPAIVVNRVVGAVGRGKIRAALITEGEFVAENHVNTVTPRPGVEQKIGYPELLRRLSADTTSESVQMLTGNSQISATELNHLLPLSE